MPTEAVKVMVRCRPFNKREQDLKCASCVQIETKSSQVTLSNGKAVDSMKSFSFDAVFSQTDS